MRHAERARKPSIFFKSVHYNKSYASETPMQSIEFTAIVWCSYSYALFAPRAMWLETRGPEAG